MDEIDKFMLFVQLCLITQYHRLYPSLTLMNKLVFGTDFLKDHFNLLGVMGERSLCDFLSAIFKQSIRYLLPFPYAKFESIAESNLHLIMFLKT